MRHSHLEGITPGDSQSVATVCQIDNSYIHDKRLDLHFYSLEIFGSFIQNLSSGNIIGAGAITGVLAFTSNVHENHQNLGLGTTPDAGATPGCGLIMRECTVRKQATGNFLDAITVGQMGMLRLAEITCRDNDGSGVAVLAPARVSLETVRGFNNGITSGRPGVLADDGGHVKNTASDVDVTGQLTDTATAGAGASVIAGAPANRLRISGLVGIGPGDVGKYLKLTGAGYEIHNDTFLITTFVGAAVVDVLMVGIIAPLDAHNGAINWIVRSAGVDLKAGGMSVRTWDNFRTVAPIKNEFDVPGFTGVVSADTTTGARIWEA